MSYDAECYCATNDGVPCVFCEIETGDRLASLGRSLRDAGALQLAFIVSAGNRSFVGVDGFPWHPGCGREIPKPRHP